MYHVQYLPTYVHTSTIIFRWELFPVSIVFQCRPREQEIPKSTILRMLPLMGFDDDDLVQNNLVASRPPDKQNLRLMKICPMWCGKRFMKLGTKWVNAVVGPGISVNSNFVDRSQVLNLDLPGIRSRPEHQTLVPWKVFIHNFFFPFFLLSGSLPDMMLDG